MTKEEILTEIENLTADERTELFDALRRDHGEEFNLIEPDSITHMTEG
jgi:hypothetical protein